MDKKRLITSSSVYSKTRSFPPDLRPSVIYSTVEDRQTRSPIALIPVSHRAVLVALSVISNLLRATPVLHTLVRIVGKGILQTNSKRGSMAYRISRAVAGPSFPPVVLRGSSPTRSLQQGGFIRSGALVKRQEVHASDQAHEVSVGKE
jgi:hypothetical protein